MMSEKSSADNNTNTKQAGSAYRRLWQNRKFMLLWSGQTVSTFGDAFFNLAVMWVVYTQSRSLFQTALIQVIWQLSDILFGPVAGVLADRWDRKRIMMVTNLLAALVVGGVAALMGVQGEISPLAVFVAIFLLNSLTTFLAPARFSIMPAVVERSLLTTASGLFSTAGQLAAVAGNALAGVLVAAVGAVWAVIIDAGSFLFVALCIMLARLPSYERKAASAQQRPSFWRELREGWQAIADQPVVRALMWLGLLINVPSFLGPLYPALVDQRLQGGATEYGLLEAVSIVGGMVGALVVGPLERRLGAGWLLITGWGIAGLCTLGVAFSTSLIITAVLEALHYFTIVVGSIALGVLTQTLIAQEYLGRVAGITRSLGVIAIPFSTLLAGWLADRIGLIPLFVVGAVWVLGVAGLAALNPHVRAARISQQ